MKDTLAYVYLHSIGISQKKLMEIFASGCDIKEFYEKLNSEKLKKYYNSTAAEKILQTKQSLESSKIDALIQKQSIDVIRYDMPTYPDSLRQIASPPFLLYVKGKLDTTPKLGVIGSRKMTDYGKKVIESFVPKLIQYFTIVSGGAFGCDTCAHKTTLHAGGKTIAVIGTGIDISYPAQNKAMYTDIVEYGGAIVSIFSLGTSGTIYTFPLRNEIIAALSNGILIAEAAEKSGTLITSRLALDQGKDVFAVPGDINRLNSLGCLEIIKKGEAKLVSHVDDIFEEYNISISQKNELPSRKIIFSNSDEKDIYDVLILEEKTIDELAKKLGKSISDLSIKISSLELRGAIVKNSLGKYQIK